MSVHDADAEAQPAGLEGPAGRSGSLHPWIAAAIIAVSCVLAVALLFDLWPPLQGTQWRWDYVAPSATRLAATGSQAYLFLGGAGRSQWGGPARRHLAALRHPLPHYLLAQRTTGARG